MATIPDSLRTPERRAAYLVEHYWDRFDFSDTSYIHAPEATEQGLANYLDLLRHFAAPERSAASLRTLLTRAEQSPALLRHLAALLEKYLYDDGSPLRDEEMYIPVLEYLVADEALNETERLRPRLLLEQARKNRPGSVATDFAFTRPDGREGRLRELPGDYTLLLFYAPTCDDCHAAIRRLSSSSAIQEALAEKRLTILALYPGADKEAWRKGLAKIPPEWVNAYDPAGTIQGEELYDLRRYPTIYLLDTQKRVILKEAEAEEVEKRLSILC